MKNLVYVVDDEQICLVPMQALISAFGYECQVFSDGESLLGQMKDEGHVLVLADMRMPNMNGLQLFERLRNAGFQCPFVLVSGHADSETVDHAFEIGVNGFLPKPFEPEELQEVIERHLGPI